MVFMYTITYPSTSGAEFAKAVLKNAQEHPLPDFIVTKALYGLVVEGGGKAIAILEYEKGKEEEALKIGNKRLANYLKVPGFGWREERLMTMEECFSMIDPAELQ